MTKRSSTASKRRKLVTSYYESGRSQSAFARAHGINKGKLSYWINKILREEDKEPVKSNFVFLLAPPAAHSVRWRGYIRRNAIRYL